MSNLIFSPFLLKQLVSRLYKGCALWGELFKRPCFSLILNQVFRNDFLINSKL